jgi:molybdopterin converting factor small subunit
VTIEVRLFANLAEYLPRGTPGAAVTLDLPEGASVDDVLRHLAIPAELPCLTLVNGREPVPGHLLGPGDVVSLLPPLAGG